MAPASRLRSVAATRGVSPSGIPSLHGAVEVDWAVEALLAQQRHHPLRLAQRIGADDVRPLREEAHGIEELTHLLPRVGMVEDR
jgi:hypothetical protein